MNLKELQDYLHIEETTAYALVKKREFPSFKIPGCREWYIDEKKLIKCIDRWINNK